MSYCKTLKNNKLSKTRLNTNKPQHHNNSPRKSSLNKASDLLQMEITHHNDNNDDDDDEIMDYKEDDSVVNEITPMVPVIKPKMIKVPNM